MNPVILEKIKKLLRLGESPNQGESELALEKAFEIATKYGVDLGEVTTEDNPKESVEWQEVFDTDKRNFKMEKIDGIVGKFFNVYLLIFHKEGKVVWVGKPTDIFFAKWVRDYLDETWSRLAKEAKEEALLDGKLFDYKSFYLGVTYSLYEKLMSMQKNMQQNPGDKYALALRKTNDELAYFLRSRGVRITVRQLAQTNISEDVYRQGVEAGKGITINRPLSGSRPPSNLQLNR